MDCYHQCCVPDPCTILGRKLKPYSIGHQILLKRWGCAFVVPSDTVTWKDLAIGLLICSRSYSESLRILDSDAGIKEYKSILSLIKTEFESKCLMFARYIEEGRSGPDNVTWKDGEQSYASPEATLKFCLMSQIGYTEEQALSIPYGQARYEFCVWQQYNGTAAFFDEEKQELNQESADKFHELWVSRNKEASNVTE